MKKRTHRRYRIMPNITIIIIVATLIMLCNFPLFVYTLNRGSYAKQPVEVLAEGYDGLIALVPKITVSYKYEGKKYEEYFLDYNSILFHDDNISEVYVNTSSPSNILFVHSFWKSYTNIILIEVIGICVVIIINNIRRLKSQYVEERFNRKVQGQEKSNKEVKC